MKYTYFYQITYKADVDADNIEMAARKARSFIAYENVTAKLLCVRAADMPPEHQLLPDPERRAHINQRKRKP